MTGSSDEAVTIADRWLKECREGTSPAERIAGTDDAGNSDLTEAGNTIIVTRLAQQLVQLTLQTGPAAMLAILSVLLSRTLQALNDDPRLKAVASEALADVAQAARLLEQANTTIAGVP